MVLALLTIIRPLQIPPVWSVQKLAAERMGKTVHSVQPHAGAHLASAQAKPALRIVETVK